MTATDFASLGLSEAVLLALRARKYTTPTPIQARCIPHLLQGRDLLGIAQTGTGKTAAFSLPMLDLLMASGNRPRARMPRALVLAPTRELASQIAESCEAYGRNLPIKVAIVFGGVGQTPQVQALRRGVDILVATPGRLLDLINQKHCDLSDVEILVLDEADRMLDMGFLPDVKRILARVPEDRQSLLFSATMPEDITALSKKYLNDPLRVEVTPPAATADRIEQSVHFVPKAKKRDLLLQLLLDPAFVRTLVFTRTKHGADRVARHLDKGGVEAHAIHGDKSQGARERALEAFRAGKCHALVATDIAARGIDVKEISHVINFDLPNIPESYVHRIGRTARAGSAGIAISFCDEGEHEYLRDIEKLIKKKIPVAGGAKRSESDVPRERTTSRPPRRRQVPGAHGKAPEREMAANDGGEPRRHVDDRQRQTQPQPAPKGPKPHREPAQHNGQRPRSGTGKPAGKPPFDQRRPKRRGRPAMPNAVDPEQRRPWTEEERRERMPQRGHGQGFGAGVNPDGGSRRPARRR